MDSKEDFECGSSGKGGSAAVTNGKFPSDLPEGIISSSPLWARVQAIDDDAPPSPRDIHPEAVQPLASAASKAANGASVKKNGRYY